MAIDWFSAVQHYVLHWTPERAIYVGGHSFLWDARCAGIYVGFAVALVWMLAYFRRNNSFASPALLGTHALLCLPFVFDVLSIALGWRRPVNDIRFLTGLLVGSGLCLMLYPSFVAIVFPRATRQQRPDLDGRYLVLLLGVGAMFGLRYCDVLAAWLFFTALMIIGFCATIGLVLTNVATLALGLLLPQRL